MSRAASTRAKGKEANEPKFRPIVRSAVTREAIGRIKDLIRSGELQPGDRLPPERELAKELQLSRNSLREAIRALVLMNILYSRQGDGTYVTSLEPKLLIEPIDFVLGISNEAVDHVYEMRGILESSAARLAAMRITDAQLAQLDHLLDELEHHTKDLDLFLQRDIEFHDIILRAADNPLLTRFMDSIRALAVHSRTLTVHVPGVTAATVADHAAIFDGLKRRDPAAASEAMTAHVSHVHERYSEAQSPQGGTGGQQRKRRQRG